MKKISDELTADVEMGGVDFLAAKHPQVADDLRTFPVPVLEGRALSLRNFWDGTDAAPSMFELKRCRRTLSLGVAKIKQSRGLTLLGRSEAKLPASPAEARLETFPNPARRNYHIHFETDDFTSLCPVTGQADFARIDIDYIPDRLCVESKSLKFYLASYRKERAFNEAVTNRILDDFVKACAPREAIVTAQFSARGGIALTVRAEYPDKNIREKKMGRDGR